MLQTEQLGRRILRRCRELAQQHYPTADFDGLARRCGLRRDWSAAQEEGNSLQACLVLLRELRQGPAEPDFALRVGDSIHVTDYGLLGYAILTAPTVMQAARVTCSALSASNYLLRGRLVLTDEHCLVVFTIAAAARAYRPELMEISIVPTWRYIQTILPEGSRASPSYVTLNYPPPACAADYEAMLGCPVRFNETHTVMALPLSLMSLATPPPNPAFLAACSSDVKTVLGPGYQGSGIVTRVRQTLIENPQVCHFSLEDTARQMHLSGRTLRRQLAHTGTSFRRVCLEVRMALAQQYLANTGMSLKEVAYQLGYTHSNNFIRAYRDYTGRPPKSDRERIRRGE